MPAAPSARALTYDSPPTPDSYTESEPDDLPALVENWDSLTMGWYLQSLQPPSLRPPLPTPTQPTPAQLSRQHAVTAAQLSPEQPAPTPAQLSRQHAITLAQLSRQQANHPCACMLCNNIINTQSVPRNTAAQLSRQHAITATPSPQAPLPTPAQTSAPRRTLATRPIHALATLSVPLQYTPLPPPLPPPWMHSLPHHPHQNSSSSTCTYLPPEVPPPPFDTPPPTPPLHHYQQYIWEDDDLGMTMTWTQLDESEGE